MTDAMLTDPGWACDRCGRPVVQTGDGEWAHAEVADELFCDVVLGAKERVAATPQPLGIPKDVLTDLVETNARLMARDPHRPECGDLDCDGCRNEATDV